MRTNELMKEPRLAHPGLADHRDDLTPARASLLLSLAQVLELDIESLNSGRDLEPRLRSEDEVTVPKRFL